jgi:oligopeptidase B
MLLRIFEEDLGRQWYDDGKLLKKRNTFTIDCSKYVIQYNYTSADICMQKDQQEDFDGSVNEAPELYNGVIKYRL